MFNKLTVLNCQAQQRVILLISLVGNIPIQEPLSRAQHISLPMNFPL